MIFTEARFLWFFAVVFVLYWGTRSHVFRRVLLLAASYVFYGAWDWRFLGLIVLSTLVDYFAGIGLASASGSAARRGWLALSLVTNLGLLGVFKYYDFFVAQAASLSAWLGLPMEPTLLEVVLPAGISFYTFQTLSYTLDVYRGSLAPTRNLLDFSLFVAFFPQLVAGPIVRAVDFLPQLRTPRVFASVEVRACLLLFLVGYVKKAVVSDGVAPVVQQVFDDPLAWGLLAKWLAAALYTVQIYCDFSGYSDMAIASAGLLGYRLTLNFDFPYLARSITQFWRRWHISLSTWFRDYLYIPLGGSRVSAVRTGINLATVFLLCGLWHGARWTFVLWGLYHGAFLVLERVLGRRRERSAPGPAASPRRRGAAFALAHGYALLVTVIGWVLFRSTTLADAGAFLAGMWPGEHAAGASIPHAALWWTGLLAFALVHVAMSRRVFERAAARLSDWTFAAAYGAAVGFVLPWVATDFQPFIYFQF